MEESPEEEAHEKAGAFYPIETDMPFAHLEELEQGILTSRDGQKKNVVCEYRYLINQIDRLEDDTRKELREVMQKREECGGMVSLHQIEEKYL